MTAIRTPSATHVSDRSARCARGAPPRPPGRRAGRRQAPGQAVGAAHLPLLQVAARLRAPQRARNRRAHRRADARRRPRSRRCSPARPRPTPLPSVAASAPPAAADSKRGAESAVPDFSSTNVQEAGVDEPDIVKTDGRTVYAIAEGKLHALDVSGADAAPRRLACPRRRLRPPAADPRQPPARHEQLLRRRADRLRRDRLGVAGRAQRGRHQRPRGDEGAAHDDDGGRARRRPADRRHAHASSSARRRTTSARPRSPRRPCAASSRARC